MPQTVNEQTVDAVTIVDVKNGAEMPGLTAGFASQAQQQQQAIMNANQVANQQSVQAIINQSLQVHTATMNALAGRVSRLVMDVSAEQAAGFAKELTAGLASEMQQFGADLASIQQDIKAAQSTPPETAVGQALANLAASMAAIEAMLKARPA